MIKEKVTGHKLTDFERSRIGALVSMIEMGRE